jgi:hypothetical protein
MDNVVDHYQQYIDRLAAEPPNRPSLRLPSLDLDTGKPTAPAEYALADQTYARYLALLVKPRPPAPPPTPSAPWPPPEQPDVQLAGSTTQAAPSPEAQPSDAKPARLAAPAPAAASPETAEQPPPQPALQPVDRAIRADIERYFAHAATGELLLEKKQQKQLPKDLQTLRQLPAASPAPTAGLPSPR